MVKDKAVRDSIFVRIDEEDICNSRKELLSTKLNALNLLKNFRGYRELRTSELAKKEILRRKLDLIKRNLKVLLSLLPQLDRNMTKIGREVDKIEEKEKEKSDMAIERELKEVRAELEGLENR